MAEPINWLAQMRQPTTDLTPYMQGMENVLSTTNTAMQTRLNAMKLKDAVEQSQFKNVLVGALQDQAARQAATTWGTMRPKEVGLGAALQDPSLMQQFPLQTMELQQQQRQTQAEAQKAALESTTKIADVIHKLGPERFKELQPSLARLNPAFANIDASALKVEGGKTLYQAQTPDGKPISGVYLGYDENNKLHIVKTPVTEELGSFRAWSPDEKEFWFQQAQTGNMPKFAFGDKKSYTDFNKELAAWAKGRGQTGGEFAASQAEAKALKGSLSTQEKTFGMMSGFVDNLNRQVNRLETITKDVERYDSRLLNMPLIAWRTRVAGTPYENIISMYNTEISTEIGKIASGSSASVAELSASAREKWEKIHDEKLPIKDLLAIMKETSHAANMRKSSALEAIQETQKRLGGTTPGTVPRGTSEPKTFQHGKYTVTVE